MQLTGDRSGESYYLTSSLVNCKTSMLTNYQKELLHEETFLKNQITVERERHEKNWSRLQKELENNLIKQKEVKKEVKKEIVIKFLN